MNWRRDDKDPLYHCFYCGSYVPDDKKEIDDNLRVCCKECYEDRKKRGKTK
jgi:hypothetical protein